MCERIRRRRAVSWRLAGGADSCGGPETAAESRGTLSVTAATRRHCGHKWQRCDRKRHSAGGAGMESRERTPRLPAERQRDEGNGMGSASLTSPIGRKISTAVTNHMGKNLTFKNKKAVNFSVQLKKVGNTCLLKATEGRQCRDAVYLQFHTPRF